jgi:hypothetical protein
VRPRARGVRAGSDRRRRRRLVEAIVANAPLATRACKRLVRDVAGREISSELRADTARRIADIRVSAEGREGIQSFLDKRKPAWQNDKKT